MARMAIPAAPTRDPVATFSPAAAPVVEVEAAPLLVEVPLPVEVEVVFTPPNAAVESPAVPEKAAAAVLKAASVRLLLVGGLTTPTIPLLQWLALEQ